MKSDVLEDKLETGVVSQDLIQEAIETFPSKLQPIHKGYVILKFNGINSPGLVDDIKRKRKYLDDCSENNILPFSRMKYQYGPQSEVFIVDEVRISSYKLSTIEPNLTKKLLYRKSNRIFLDGGKVNEIEVSIDSQKAFEVFRGEFLDILLDKGYELQEGWFYTGDNIGAGGLLFGINNNNRVGYKKEKGLELKFRNNLPEENKIQLTNWFNQLVEGYQ